MNNATRKITITDDNRAIENGKITSISVNEIKNLLQNKSVEVIISNVGLYRIGWADRNGTPIGQVGPIIPSIPSTSLTDPKFMALVNPVPSVVSSVPSVPSVTPVPPAIPVPPVVPASPVPPVEEPILTPNPITPKTSKVIKSNTTHDQIPRFNS